MVRINNASKTFLKNNVTKLALIATIFIATLLGTSKVTNYSSSSSFYPDASLLFSLSGTQDDCNSTINTTTMVPWGANTTTKTDRRRVDNQCLEPVSRPREKSIVNQTTSFLDFLAGPALGRPRRKSSQLEEYDKTNTTEGAICLYRHDLLFSNHFPHAMQQLYRCLSWWFAHPNIPWILLFNHSRIFNDEVRSSPFLAGILLAMEEALNVTIRLPPNNNSDSVEVIPPYVRLRSLQSYAMLHAETDALTLRNRILEHYNVPHNDDSNYNLDADDDIEPRIAILDRKPGERRHILNVQRLATLLSDEVYPNGTRSVRIEYFKRKTFLQQVEFYANHDIVISPHGAQLTGVSFMPSGCSSVLELFPKNYYLPTFFGSLCNVSNIQHSFIYLSDQDGDKEYSIFTSHEASKEARLRARNVPICAPVTEIIKSVQELVLEWKQCRRRYNNQTKSTNQKRRAYV